MPETGGAKGPPGQLGDGASNLVRQRPRPDVRLKSWKEIAEYIDRDVRTAHRWERDGLPVHRLMHEKGASVYAEPAEIDEWLAKRSGGPPPSPAPPPQSRRVPSPWLWFAAAGLVVAAAGLVAWLLRSPAEAPAPPLEAVPLTAYEGIEMHPSFSPDGSEVAFAWNGTSRDNYDIYIKIVGTGSPVRLTTDTGSDFDPAWSPDGTQIAFCRLGQGIFVIPPIGGAERMLFEDPDTVLVGYRYVALSARRLSWSPDGKYLAFARGATGSGRAGIFVVGKQGGPARRITLNEADADWAPAFSPDGRRLAFARCASPGSCSVQMVDVDAEAAPAGPARQLTERSGYVGSIAWTPDGQAIVFSQADVGPLSLRLWRLPVRNPGKPQLLSFAGPGSDSVTISRSRSRMAYSYFYGDADLWKMEGGASSRSALSSTRRDDSPQFSPDGKRIAFSSERSGHQEIWIADVDGSNAFQLTTSRASGTARWSPDGKRIVYDTQAADGLWDIDVIDATGGKPTPLVRHPADDKAPSFSHDGRWVYFSSNRDGRDEIDRIPATGGDAVKLTDNGGYVAFESMDGQSIYYTKTGVGCGPLFMRSLKGGPERQVAESVCERGFVVHPNGIYLLSNNPDNQNVDLMLLDPTSGQSRMVAASVGRLDLGLTVSPDGKTIFFSTSTQYGADLMLVDGIR